MTRRSRSNSRREGPIVPSAAVAFAIGCGIPPLLGAWTRHAEVEVAALGSAALAAAVAIGLAARGHAARRIAAAVAVALLGSGLAIRAGRWATVSEAEATIVPMGHARLAAGAPGGERRDVVVPLDGLPATVRGRAVASPRKPPPGSDWIAHELDAGDRLRFELEEVTVESGPEAGSRQLRGRLRVAWTGAEPPIRPGDRIEVRGWLFPAGISRNPRPAPRPEDAWPFGGRRESIVGTIAAGPGSIRTLSTAPRDLSGRLSDAREILRARVERVLERAAGEGGTGPPDPRPALAMTMLFGRGSHDDPETRDHFARSGLSHLVAISGFNFAVLGLGASIVLRGFGGPWRMTAVVTGMLALAYLVVVDDEPSVARAGLVAVAGASAESLGRRHRSMSLLGVAALALLVADPLAIADPGFQLTFAAVLALRWAATPLGRRWYGDSEEAPDSVLDALVASVRGLLVSCIAVWLVVTPISVVHFGQVSWLGLPLSIPAIPIGGLAIGNGLAVAGAAAIDERLAIPLAHAWIMLTGAVLAIAELPARWQVPDLDVGRIGWGWAAIASALAIVWCRATLRPLRRLALGGLVAGWAPLATAALSGNRSEGPEWTMLDVGDGSCHLLRRGTLGVIFDAGSLDHRSLGIRTVVPALRSAGVRRLEAVIVSHPNLDHFGAVPAILARFPTDRLILNRALIEAAEHDPTGGSARLVGAARSRGVPIEIGEFGRTADFLGARWNWLHPHPDDRYARDNDSSQVIEVRWADEDGRLGLLLAGDLETDGVRDLLGRSPEMEVDVFELPHHGSWRPAVAAWVETVRPRAVFQSTGPERWRRDRWGPVLGETIRRVTCIDGAVRARVGSLGGTGPSVVLLERWDRNRWQPCGMVNDAATAPGEGGSRRRSGRDPPRSPRSRSTDSRRAPSARSRGSRPRRPGERPLRNRSARQGRKRSRRHSGRAETPRQPASTLRAEATTRPLPPRESPDRRHPRARGSSTPKNPAGRTTAKSRSTASRSREGTPRRRPRRPRAGTREGPRAERGSIRDRPLRSARTQEVPE